MLYTDPHPEPGTVDYTIDSHSDEFYSFPASFRAQWMDRHCPRGRLLEVGCGSGHFLVAARRLGHEVTGLEPHSERVRHCREVHGIAIDEAFLEDHRLPGRHFDVVYHIDLLAHFVDPLAAMRSMVDLLRPGGVLCLEVGILGGLSSRWYRWVGQIGIEHHLWLYSEEALHRLFEKSGLRVVHRKRFGLAPLVFYCRAATRGYRMAKRVLGRPSQVAAVADDSPRNNLTSTSRRLRSCFHWLYYFSRYRLGSVAPNVGPQTMFFVLRPD